MTTEESDKAAQLDRMNDNLAKVEELSQRLVTALSRKKTVRPSLQGPDQDLFATAAAAYMSNIMANPSKLIEQQVGYWGKALKHFVEAQQQLAQGKFTPPVDETPPDRRFQNELWQTHPYFNFVKQQYMMSTEAMREAVQGLEGLDDSERKRVEFFTQQIMDMMSPTNFLATNPEALTRAVETEGESLVKGLENLVRDIDAHDGELLVTLADKDAFKVGENLATTEGSVVYRNRLFELIQYVPKTDKVHKTPLVIFPPWINKFYILDLKPANSLINWIIEQGYTLFVVSWVNPDASYADVALDDYIEEGYLTAIDEVKKITGERQINTVGYCIAGTTLALTLALMKKRGDKSIKSATFFTTLTDFSDQGEVGVFLNDDFVDGIEREVKDHGYLSSFFMSRTFSFLRSNDLIYGPAIRSYMMGESPPAFDLLFWNGDSTNLPAKMSVQYLRELCQDDKFAKGSIKICGETLGLKDVTIPICAVACETDHIAAWKSSFNGVRQMGAKDRTFILSQSGHIAGIVNPPSKKKYGHYLNPDMDLEPDAWEQSADFHQGSWWPHWDGWLSKRSGAKIKAREPGDSQHPILGPAPGTYVTSNPKA
ncbi:MAG: class I poly(R)-hydroxyalkanoic acid synthase [Rhodobacteraceae bacterium]|nr:class I poly(R)-hydroxyalkanoic acid synthase [Paracoccaceae bacterium]